MSVPRRILSLLLSLCGVHCIGGLGLRSVNFIQMPVSTEPEIEELCAKIRALCGDAYTPEREDELRHLARELRAAINKHVRMAKSSLNAKKAAITEAIKDWT